MATTQAKPQTISFYTKSTNLWVSRVPELVENVNGMIRVTQEAVAYDFAPDGRLVVEEHQDWLPTGAQEREEDGTLSYDKDGYPVLSYEDAPTYLRRSKSFNVFFFEDGNEPDLLRPTVDEVLDELVDATISLDAERVQALLEKEQETHQRQVVTSACEKALARIARSEESVE